MSRIIVSINEEGFEYDIHSLVKAFYPEADVKVILPSNEKDDKNVEDLLVSSDEGLPDIFIKKDGDTFFMTLVSEKESVVKKVSVENMDRSQTKNVLKQLIYTMLSEHQKRELPWGTLTGIRPTKIARTLLEDEANEAEIDEYLKTVYLASDEKIKLSIDIASLEKRLLDKIHYKDGYSLYIGIPFCPTTCLYCSFTSYPIVSWKKRVGEYLEALFKEIDYVKEAFADKIIDTIYVGGGTPTTLEPDEMELLLKKINDSFDMSTVKELTVESGRADSITKEKLQVMKDNGVTRISVNPQTMNQSTLDIIGRRHTVDDVVRAFNDAREVGFDNINMDIILGLPGEDVDEVGYTIEEIKKLDPDSLTVHSLAIKRASKLSEWIKENGITALNNTDETMKVASEGAKSMGMLPYYLYRQKNMSGNFENVGYAKAGKEGLYNILIMEEVQTIIACGAGTVTKRVWPLGDGVSGSNARIERCDTVKDVGLYIEKIDEMIDRKRQLFKD